MPSAKLLRSTLTLSAIAAIGFAGPVFAQDESADDAVASTNPPVDLHEGSCADPVLEPWFDGGNIVQRPYSEIADQMRADLSDPANSAENTNEGDMTAQVDTNGDGVIDESDDADLGNDTENTNESRIGGISELDTNGNGVVDDEELFGDVTGGTAPEMIWYNESGVDSDFAGLFDNNNIIAIHESPKEYANILACGEVGGADYQDKDRIIIPMNGVGGNNYQGFAVFGNDFSENQTGIRVYLFEDQMTSSTPMAGTPMATPAAANEDMTGTPTGG